MRAWYDGNQTVRLRGLCLLAIQHQISQLVRTETVPGSSSAYEDQMEIQETEKRDLWGS